MTKHDQNTHILNHPLLQHKLTILRDKKTPTPIFRQVLKEIALLMGYDVTRNLRVIQKTIETPLSTHTGLEVQPESIVIVPVLRAGLGMVDGLLELLPTALQGHIGVFRDPTTRRPVEYMVKIPNKKDALFILIDPMIATGYSALHAIDALTSRGVLEENILFMALVASPEGMAVLRENYPTIPVYLAALDTYLDDHDYIVPGLGDAGDRLFGTN
jgi:uracil phosphoribosyltransferase